LGLARNSLRTFISQIIATLLQFIVGILTAQFLGPEGKGLLYILIVWLGICTQLGGLGLGEASIYLIGNDPKRLPAIFGNLLVASGALSLVVGSAGWLFLGYGRPSIYTQFPLWVWAVVAFLVPIHLLQSFLMQVLSAVLRIKEINIVDVMRPMIQLLLFILLVIIIEYGVKGAFLAYALSVSFAATIFFILVLYHAKQLPRPDWKLLAVSLRYGIKTYLSSFLGLLALRLDALLVASLATNGIVAAGVYSVSTSLAELLLFIPTSIRLSLFPMVSAASTAEANRLTSAASRHTALLTTILALGLGVAGPLAIPRLYGEAFAGAMTPLLLLLPGVIMLCQALIFYGDLIGRGKPEATIISALLSLIATVVLDLLLIPKYGIVGAALASSCAYTVEFIIAGSFFVYHSGLPWRKLFLFQRSDLASYLGVLLAVRKIIGLAH
jgi:O-antigen/teichoic acid export membrane protein